MNYQVDLFFCKTSIFKYFMTIEDYTQLELAINLILLAILKRINNNN